MTTGGFFQSQTQKLKVFFLTAINFCCFLSLKKTFGYMYNMSIMTENIFNDILLDLDCLLQV